MSKRGRKRKSRAGSAAPPGPRPNACAGIARRPRPPGGGLRSITAQALGRLPWFAALPARDLRLRPRLLMGFSSLVAHGGAHLLRRTAVRDVVVHGPTPAEVPRRRTP